VLSTDTNTCPQPWPPLIDELVDDALLELSSAFKILQGSVATLFRWSWKIQLSFSFLQLLWLGLRWAHSPAGVIPCGRWRSVALRWVTI